MKDKLQDKVAGSIKYKGLIHSLSDSFARIGISKDAVAVFEQISVKNAAKMVTIRTTTQGSSSETADSRRFAIHVENPEASFEIIFVISIIS